MPSESRNPNPDLCPSREILAQLGVGQLAPAELERWAGHVETCEACQVTLNELAVADTLSDAMRRSGPTDGTGDPAIDALIDRLQELGATIGRSAFDASKTSAVPDAPEEDDLSFLAPPQGADELGRLGSYRVLEIIGRGGMGLVFVAKDVVLRRRVALKVIRPGVAATRAARDRFLREAQAAAAIESDHIVPIYQVGEDRGVPFLAMQLLKGESLEARLRRDAKLSTREILQIGREVALGLAAAHDHGLVHRDIKPANIWLESRSQESDSSGSGGTFRVKILDFGLARLVRADVQITQSGALLGTPAYMAPEQAAGQPTDARSDLFSLGCVLYRLAAGVAPFHRPELTATLLALTNETPPPMESSADMPQELSDLIVALLEKNPDRRPPGAHEVVQKLRQIEAGPTQPATKTPAATQGSGPSRRWWTALTLMVVFIAGLTGYQLILRTGDGTLIVHVDGDADVRFQKGELRIHDTDGKLKYTLKPSVKNKTLPPGQYLIDVAGVDGLKLETNRFSLERDGQATVRVMVDAGTLAVHSDDAERRAAEWVLSMGGTVWVGEVGTDRFRRFNSAKDLPPGPLGITRVALQDNRITSDDLVRLQPLTHLVFLSVHSKLVTDAGLAHLKPLAKLRELHIVFAPLTDAGLVHLSGFEGLHHLGLDSPQITEEGLRHLSALTNLRGLRLNHTATGDKVLDLVKALPALREFAPGTNFTDEGLRHLRALRPKLGTLNLNGTRVTDAGLVQIKGWNTLVGLDFYGSDFGDDGVKHLADLPSLNAVSLGNSRVTDAGMAHLKRSTSIELLYLWNTAVTDAGLVHLADLKSLKQLVLKGTKVTADGVKKLAAALPACSIDWDGGTIEPSVSPR